MIATVIKYVNIINIISESLKQKKEVRWWRSRRNKMPESFITIKGKGGSGEKKRMFALGYNSMNPNSSNY